MARLLFLVHRLPYPPNKGDKVRSYHLLKHLAARHEVHLGTFVDDPDDWQHVDHLRTMCAQVHACGLSPRSARLASLWGLATGEPLTLRYYRSASLRAWVRDTAAHVPLDAAVVFSSSMAPYALNGPQVPVLVDFVDVDSAKWRDYAPQHAWPLSWLYAREGRRLLAYEREVAQKARRSFFVTEKEADIFRAAAPESAGTVDALGNGVDAEHFAPVPGRTNPFEPGETALVFTGAMDYWPNVDAVTWCARDILPAVRQQWPSARFYIVGRSPTPAVQALASEHVVVTGTVDDVRPYLQHAALAVAPLRLARGIQNKVLEAMAMERAVVTSTECAGALEAQDGDELVSVGTAEEFARAIDRLLRSPEQAAAIGRAARQRVLQAYSWQARLSALDAWIPDGRAAVGQGTVAAGAWA